jgi:hypothetical protein
MNIIMDTTDKLNELYGQLDHIETNPDDKVNSGNDDQTTKVMDSIKQMKPIMNDFMNQIFTMFNKNKQVNENTNSHSSEDSNTPDNDDNDDNNDNNETDIPNNETKPFANTLDNVFSMLEGIMKNINKYKEKPHLAVMPQIFQTMSKMSSASANELQDVEHKQYIESITTNATKVCEMLKDKEIEDLCDVQEFKSCVLDITIDFNKMFIMMAKKGIEKMELEVGQFNDTTPIDTLMKNIVQKFDKK